MIPRLATLAQVCRRLLRWLGAALRGGRRVLRSACPQVAIGSVSLSSQRALPVGCGNARAWAACVHGRHGSWCLAPVRLRKESSDRTGRGAIAGRPSACNCHWPGRRRPGQVPPRESGLSWRLHSPAIAARRFGLVHGGVGGGQQGPGVAPVLGIEAHPDAEGDG
jgi:hypothetical protein